MLDEMHVPIDNPIEGKDEGRDWYMNKSFKSRTVKVLSSVHGGCCKMRFMNDLLRGQQMPHLAQPTQPGVSACNGSSSVSDAIEPEYDANLALAEDDEDDDIGKMTLKEIHQFLKKSAQKSSKKQSLTVSSSICPQSNASAADTMPILDCSLQLSGLELHLDSSTSNSAESSDDLSPSGITTSLHKPIDIVIQEVDCPGLALKKRKSTVDSGVCKSEISVEDDDCTLEMWQLYKRRSYEGKKPRRCGVERAPCMEEQTSCESSMTPAANLVAFCTINLAPDIDEYLLADSTCPDDAVPALGNFEQGSSAFSCSFDLSEKMRGNSLEPQRDLITSCDAVEGAGCSSDKLHPEVLINENHKTSREDVNSDEGAKHHGPLLCESSPVLSSGELLQADEAGRNPLLTEPASWLPKPCSESSSIEVSVSVQQNIESIEQEHTFRCEVLHSLDHGPRLAAMDERGPSPSVEETCSNKAASATCVMKRPIGVSNELVNSEVAELPQKKNSSEFPAVDLSKYSPPLPTKLKTGFDIVEQSSNDVNMGSQPLTDEDISGSPVSLFSTERLETEEEQEMEHLKPSKIPCKRKAISPLSRERLLHASKYGDRERNFQDLDKRGLKKLPRAFKGFIRRDTFNQECIAAFPRAKNSVKLESSPPEKPHLKEEVLPGSPCHNREKFLPSKYLIPKVSSISTSYGSSGAAAIDASTMQTSSPSPSYVQRLSLVLNSSPSPPLQQSLKLINSKSPPVNSSPPIPAKGILRSSSPTCQGACKCEECVSLRCRAEKAAEFSQRQMHDIEGLAVKLLKELNTMRCVVEESLIHRSAPRVDSPQSALSLEQVKKAANNAFETEKMAKSWLVRMARDCNRYCKIMRMQERKLTFADESGGQLCHVKLFHTQAQTQPDTILSTIVTEKPTMASSVDKGSACPPDGPAIDVAST